jgi:uncharacterized membrane protein YedE/YeeE
MKPRIALGIAGFVFAVGLGISGMTDPRKVIGFLDVTGKWDPSLAFVMMGAIGVHALAAWWARRRLRPVLAASFKLPTLRRVDGRLLAGAALFGAGWGAAGFCPGPALVSLAGLSTGSLVFCSAMVLGAAAFRWLPALHLHSIRRWTREAPGDG